MKLVQESELQPQIDDAVSILEDNSFLKAHKFLELATIAQGRKERSTCVRLLELATEQYLSVGPLEERPKELCAVAKIYSKLGLVEESRKIISKILEVLSQLREESPWKYTNYLSYTAHLMMQDEDRPGAFDLLEEAVRSLPAIDDHYQERKQEILLHLQHYLKIKDLREHLAYSELPDIQKDPKLPRIPFDQDFDFLFSYIYLSQELVKALRDVVLRNVERDQIIALVSDIKEEWRQSVSYAILARFFIEHASNVRADYMLEAALHIAAQIPFYWVEDNALEVISGVYAEMYSKKRDQKLLSKAKDVLFEIKDPWKKARSLCRLANVHLQRGEVKLASEIINVIYNDLLMEINYTERKAMSMLLITEVFDANQLAEKSDLRIFSLRGLLRIFNGRVRQVKLLRKGAHSILNSLPSHKKKESLEEFSRFISIKKQA